MRLLVLVDAYRQIRLAGKDGVRMGADQQRRRRLGFAGQTCIDIVLPIDAQHRRARVRRTCPPPSVRAGVLIAGWRSDLLDFDAERSESHSLRRAAFRCGQDCGLSTNCFIASAIHYDTLHACHASENQEKQKSPVPHGTKLLARGATHVAQNISRHDRLRI